VFNISRNHLLSATPKRALFIINIMEKIKLKIGDVLYAKSSYSRYFNMKTVVIDLTPKFAKTRRGLIERESDSSFKQRTNGGIYPPTYWCLENLKIKEEYNTEILINKLKDFFKESRETILQKLSFEDLENLYNKIK